MLEIRRMSIEDLDQVMEIERDSFSVPWTRQDFIESIEKPTALYLVAVSEQQVIGYCGLWGVIDEGQINNVAVRKEYRGQNIGTKLLEALFEEGTKEGLGAYTLEVRTGNSPAIALYKRLDFKEAGIRKNYYTNPKEDALIMWRYTQSERSMDHIVN